MILPRLEQRIHGKTEAADLCARTPISAVAAGLGLPVRRGRAIATWRKGEHYSVSLCDVKHCWHDHATGDGGGVLALIERARGCDRQDALKWLADFTGVPLVERTWTAAERREWGRRRAAAEREAAAVESWRLDVLDAIQLRRDEHLHLYHLALRWILCRGLDSEHGIAIADVADLHEAKYQHLDAHLGALRQAAPGDWARAWRDGRAA